MDFPPFFIFLKEKMEQDVEMLKKMISSSKQHVEHLFSVRHASGPANNHQVCYLKTIQTYNPKLIPSPAMFKWVF